MRKIFTLFLTVFLSVNLWAAASWCIDGPVVTIFGSGAMVDYSPTEVAPWYGVSNEITSIIIEDGVTHIGDYAFDNCKFATIESLPKSVTSVGCHAFAGYCGSTGDNLTWELDCDGVLIISGTGAMANYKNGTAPWYELTKFIKNIIVSEGVTTIGSYAFYNCKYATSLSLPNSALSIGNNAFSICQKLTSLVIPAAVANIGTVAFSSCVGLTTIRILGRPAISNGAFQNCNALKSILCASEDPSVCDANAFRNLTPANIQLFVPGVAAAAYQEAAVWKDFDIQASAKKKILFVDEAGEILKTEMVDEGVTPNADELNPTKAEDADYVYEFTGWIPAIKPATQDYVYVAHFERTPKKFFNVVIKGENCGINVSNKVPAGTILMVEAVPDECMEFQKWSDNETTNPRIITVTEDMDVSAELNKVKYTIEGQGTGGKGLIIKRKQ